MAISFGPGRPWGGVSQHEYRRMAQDPKYDGYLRVHFAALGWADRDGHASFRPGELAALLSEDGEPLTKQGANARVSHAKRLNLISPRSGVPCLVPPGYLFQKGSGASVPCRIHKAR
ncbi:hypothetical protein [Streptomyces sp. NPDC056672]|uniref:hypothetical protein n=1 Tax=Streptomyces sp. NPDC056672 TaxID=3345906 RepID=UPI0036921D50